MNKDRSLHRFLVFQLTLPILFVAPELINLGVMFLRWDYLLIAYFSILTLLIGSALKPAHDIRWNARSWVLAGVFLGFSIFQIIRLGPNTSLLDGIKYASWPLKVMGWAIGVWTMYAILRCSAYDLYRFLAITTLLVFIMQLLELSSPAFRTFLFDLYPVAAYDRLIELDYRARGPFNGYDTASLFFAVSGIFISESRRSTRCGRLSSIFLLWVCLVGAFLAARIGFLLLIIYLASFWWQGPWKYVKLVTIVLFGLAVILFSEGWYLTSSADDSLVGRYLELTAALADVDLTQIPSIAGTFHMNDVLIESGVSWLFGMGLTPETTADQLYFKYLYMYGLIGLILWVGMHITFFRQARLLLGCTQNQTIFRRSSSGICVVIALAHIKGGNYFFSARLGEIIVFILLMAAVGQQHETPLHAA